MTDSIVPFFQAILAAVRRPDPLLDPPELWIDQVHDPVWDGAA